MCQKGLLGGELPSYRVSTLENQLLKSKQKDKFLGPIVANGPVHPGGSDQNSINLHSKGKTSKVLKGLFRDIKNWYLDYFYDAFDRIYLNRLHLELFFCHEVTHQTPF